MLVWHTIGIDFTPVDFFWFFTLQFYTLHQWKWSLAF